jgi:hypothetical protein
MDQNYAEWNALAKNIAYGAWAIAVLIVIGHIIRLSTMSDAKAKYDFINKSEINLSSDVAFSQTPG